MKVDIYIETSSTYQGITDRKCSYVLSTTIRNEERTREGFGHLEGTWHQAVLTALEEALERMTVPCETAYTQGMHMFVAGLRSWKIWPDPAGETAKAN